MNIRSQYQEINRRWISQVLQAAEINQAELSRRIGVTQATISRWKSHGQIIGENIMQICLELGCQPPNWTGRSEENPTPQMPATACSPLPAQIKEIASAYKAWRLTDEDLNLLLSMAEHISKIRDLASRDSSSNQPTQRGENP